MEERLAEAIARVPGWSPWPASATVTPISGGITNQSYRVEIGGDQFVLRLDGGTAAALGIDRAHELVALCAMAEAGIGAELVFSDAAAGVLVTRLVPGRPLEPADLRLPSTAERVARLVRRVHEGPGFAGVFSPFDVVRSYEAAARARGTVIAEAEPALEIMAAIEACLTAPTPLLPCHNDLLAANLLIEGGEMHLIDWEYAAMGDPVFDVANFVTNLQLADADAEQFFEAYLAGPSSERERARLALLRFMSDLREAFWGVLQSTTSNLAFDFRSYGKSHLQRALAYAEGARFAHAHSFMRGHLGA